MLKVQFAVCVPTHWQGLAEVVVEDAGDFCWLPVQQAPAYNDLLIDDWVARPRLTCCDFQGGFLIDVENQRWNDTSIDEYWMTLSWFPAITTLLEGRATQAVAYPWEESHLILQRHENNLTLFEERYYDKFCPPVTVPLSEFSQLMAIQATDFARWARSLQQALAARQTVTTAPYIGTALTTAEKLTKIQQEISLPCIEQAENFVTLVKTRIPE